MLRWMMSLISAVAIAGPAAATEVVVKPGVSRLNASKPVASKAARQLPAGLPRPHYKYRTTIAPAAPIAPPAPYRRTVVIETDPDELITPAYGPGSYIANLPGTPLLPGSSTIPGYYGRAYDYDYQGPYYGGPYVPFWDRLPYACGVYGYC